MNNLVDRINDCNRVSVTIMANEKYICLNDFKVEGTREEDDEIVIYGEGGGEYVLSGRLVYDEIDEIQYEIAPNVYITVELIN